ncbi:MAG TPA: YceI family protein [Flavobacterium sp.]|jgi:polyisoprenoid-binding protein YceI
MKKIFLLLAFWAAFNSSAQSNWKADPNHSKLSFGITHLGLATIDGNFNKFTAAATTGAADFSDATFELSAETASIDTDVEARDKHLRSSDFFDVEKFPTMTFKSSSIRKVGTDRYQISGILTLHGIAKAVTLDMWYRSTLVNPMSKATTAGAQFTGVIKRSDFMIGPDFPEPMLSDQVMIKADVEFIRQ